MKTETDESLIAFAYENLANAIILQAVEDYEKAIACLCTRYMPEEYIYDAKKLKGSCDVFFRSKWYRTLTPIESRVITDRTKRLILNAPRMEYNEENKRFECACGFPIPKNQRCNKRVPVYKCTKCGKFTRVWGELKNSTELKEEGFL